MKNCATEDYLSTMGFDESNERVSVQLEDPATFEQKSISGRAKAVLDDIVKTCQEKDIEIIFYTVPYEGSYGSSAAVKEYAEENGCAYINFFEKIEDVGLDCNTDFQDRGHLNTSGARKIASYLGKFIVDNYDVTDVRSREGNLWNENCAR